MEMPEFTNSFLKQSQNSSAKMALAVEELFLNYQDSLSRERNYDWKKIDDFVLYTTQDVFVFFAGAYYYRMFYKMIHNFIPTGIMNYLLENYYTKKWKFRKIEKEPKVLNLDDLAFGFNIWLGFCGISFVPFIFEMATKFRNRPRKKVKNAKIHPDLSALSCDFGSNLGPELIEKFRVKNAIDLNVVNVELEEIF